MKNYIVATIKPWNIAAFHRHAETLPGGWHLVSAKDELTPALIRKIAPQYIFFPHWSWIVPQEILDAAECVCFHMTDVPYGRGGSPLQNLIIRGHKDTKLTALRMVPELDAGPVYLKKPLSLEGRAQDIFERAADLVYDMMRVIVDSGPVPMPQQGTVVKFERRTPQMSALPDTEDTTMLYNHIRMLDAQTYPAAFIDHSAFRLIFRYADLQENGTLKAQVEIIPRGKVDIL